MKHAYVVLRSSAWRYDQQTNMQRGPTCLVHFCMTSCFPRVNLTWTDLHHRRHTMAQLCADCRPKFRQRPCQGHLNQRLPAHRHGSALRQTRWGPALLHHPGLAVKFIGAQICEGVPLSECISSWVSGLFSGFCPGSLCLHAAAVMVGRGGMVTTSANFDFQCNHRTFPSFTVIKA